MSLALESGNAPTQSNQPSSFPDGIAAYAISNDEEWPAAGTLITTHSGSSTRQVLYADTGVIFTRRSQSVSLWAAWHTVNLTAV